MWFVVQDKKYIYYTDLHVYRYTYVQRCLLFLHLFFFFWSVSVLRHAASFSNPQTHLIEEVCVWVGGEGASMLSSQGDTEFLPSIITSAPALSVCLPVCVCMRAQGQPHMPP